MLYHYVRMFLQGLGRNKITSAITIFGLLIGMTSAIIIAKYVGYSLTFDRFHQHQQHIFQLGQTETKNGSPENTGSSTYQGVAVVAKQAIPEVINYTRFTQGVERLVTVSDEAGKTTSYNERGIFTVDSSFLHMFTFRLLQGSQEKALAVPYSAVITHRTAKKYFGNKNPIGETITSRVSWGKKGLWTVTGVVEDPPNNSKLQFDLLVSKPVNHDNLWELPVEHQFIQTALSNTAPSDSPALAEKISNYISSLPVFQDQGRKLSVELLPLTPSLTSFEWMLALSGLAILILSWINFVSLSIAQSLRRVGEVFIRKALGSSNRQLLQQFVLESLAINGIALLLSLLFLTFSYDYFANLTGNHLLPLFDNTLSINTLLLTSFVVGSIFTSAYPALFLVSKKVSGLSKTGRTADQWGRGARRGLVVTQFVISSVMIVGTFVISSQIDFMIHQDVGLNPTNKLIIKPPKDRLGGKQERMLAIKSELAKRSWIERVTTSTTIPGESYRQEVYFSLKGSDRKPLLYINDVDTGFARTYQVEFAAGINFSGMSSTATNHRKVIINEASARALGLTPEAAIHRELINQEEDELCEIIGVVKNYHKVSFRDAIEPTIFRYNPRRGYITLNLTSAAAHALPGKLSELKEVWQTVYADQPFEYFFLTDLYRAQYDTEHFFREVFGVFTVVSICLACLGLIGLTLFDVSRGTLEVAVRKTFGASSAAILVLFFKEYLVLLLVATIVAAPVAYYIMDAWLQAYSFRIALGIQHLLIPSLLLFVIATVTIAVQIINVSLLSPARILREE